MSTEQAKHLAAHALRRRNELDATQYDIYLAGGPSNTTLTKVEGGLLETLHRTTARKLDAGLRWEPGSARRVWEGGDPTPLLPGASPETSAAIRAAIESSDLPPEKRDRLLEVLDETG